VKLARSRLAKTLALVLPIAAITTTGIALRLGSHGTPPGHPAPQSRPAAVRAGIPASGFLVGVREQGIPGPWTPVAGFAATTGTRPRLVLFYSNWREPFRYGFAKAAFSHGAAVIVQIQPWQTPLAAIAAGKYDRYLRSYAAAVRAFARPVVIGFGHEMNGGWYPWGHTHQSPQAFAAAWRHIVDVFRSEGAGNVTWLWTASSSAHGPLRAYWPGSRYVTWVGVDGYYDRRRSSFHSVFQRTITAVRKFSQAPILLAEAAIGPVAGQARMIPNLFAGIHSCHLIGLVWYDVAQHQGIYHQDWHLEGHPRALAAFRRGVARMEKSR
jgi:mannan endo-1,4-beta-mannosidase